MKHIISLGAGVQSTVMALMAAKGEIEPMPDCAIFADTGAEPRYVYDQLDMIEANVPFPIHKVKYKEGLENFTFKENLNYLLKNKTVILHFLKF